MTSSNYISPNEIGRSGAYHPQPSLANIPALAELCNRGYDSFSTVTMAPPRVGFRRRGNVGRRVSLHGWELPEVNLQIQEVSMTGAIGYARVSTDEKARENSSLGAEEGDFGLLRTK